MMRLSLMRGSSVVEAARHVEIQILRVRLPWMVTGTEAHIRVAV